MDFTEQEVKQLVKSLNSYIRRKVRDYNNKARKQVDIGRLQEREADLQFTIELKERLLKEYYNHGRI
jgi:hypothetical protein